MITARCPFHSRLASLGFGLLLGLSSLARGEIVIPFELASLELSPRSSKGVSVPLNWNEELDEYQDVPASVRIFESASQTSSGSVTIHAPVPVVDGAELAFDATLDAWFDVSISPDNPGYQDFYSGIPSPLEILGTASARFTASGFFLADLTQPNYGFGFASTLFSGKYEWIATLVDINGNGAVDKIEVQLDTLTLNSDGKLPKKEPGYDETSQGSVAKEGIAKEGAAEKSAVEKVPKPPAGTIGVNTARLSGKVFDSLTDPPFGPFTISGPATINQDIVVNAAVPEPSSLVLFAGGLVGLAGLKGRKRRAPYFKT